MLSDGYLAVDGDGEGGGGGDGVTNKDIRFNFVVLYYYLRGVGLPA